MSLVTGSQIGPYKVVGTLGAGGMGEVYRARDTRLNRDVAVKVLPGAIRDDPARAARFEREAQVLAALNHPNIATIHGFENVDGERALIMELVEGETLGESVARGPIPWDEARTIALQLAEALETAHEQGIVHRDLKPANIKIRPDGTVKVLDFGLAKILSPSDDARQAETANSPTFTSPMMTTAGIVLGTAAYMSPEQARGRPVDKRADIWAFGCVLYEMLAGRPAFAGDNTTDVLAAIVHHEPDWTRLPANVPASATALLRRCLQKNARERLRDIGDARLELRGSSEAAASAPSGIPTTRTAAPPAASFRSRGAGLVVLAFLGGAALTGAVIYAWLASRTTETAPVRATRLTVTLPKDLTLARTVVRGSSVAISPDGSRLVYAGQTNNGPIRLYVRDLGSFEAEVIAGTEGAVNQFFSPDGRWVAFFADGRLKKVALDGGAPVSVADVRAPRGHAWLADDSILVTPENNVGLTRVSPNGETLAPFTTLREGEMSHRWPSQLPDGSAVLFSIWNDVSWESSRIAAQRAGSPEHVTVVEAGGGYPRYLRDADSGASYLVYARAEGLLASRFDPSTLKVTGTAVPVVDGVLTNASGGAHFDIARNGTVAYVPGLSGEMTRDLVWVARDGSVTPARRLEDMGRFFSLHPDGKKVLRVSAARGRDLWIEDLVRGATSRLTSAGDHFVGVWSRDGNYVIYPRGAPIANLYMSRADRPGEPVRLTTSAHNQSPTSISPDGTMLLFHQVDPVSNLDVWMLPLRPDHSGIPAGEPRPFVKSADSSLDASARFSPDGKWVAYQSNRSGRIEIYVRPFPAGEPVVQMTTEGGMGPVWSRSGTELYYRAPDGHLMSTTLGGGAASTPRRILDARPYENTFDVAPDGRFLMMRLVDSEDAPTQIHVILDFLADLRQRVR